VEKSNCAFITSYERDDEVDLDYAKARMFGYNHGRFTSPDPYNIIFEKEFGRNNREKKQILVEFLFQAQNWNRYSYVINNPTNLTDPLGLIYLRNGDRLWYVDDEYYEKNKDKEEFNGWSAVRDGTVVNLGKGGTGIFAGHDGQRVILGAGGVIIPISDQDWALGTVHDDSPGEEVEPGVGLGVGPGIPGLDPSKTTTDLYERRAQEEFINPRNGLLQTACIYRACGPLTNNVTHPCFTDFFIDEAGDSFITPGVCAGGVSVTKQQQPYFRFFQRCMRIEHHVTGPTSPCSWINPY
jgi:RHS repeat-associated protein